MSDEERCRLSMAIEVAKQAIRRKAAAPGTRFRLGLIGKSWSDKIVTGLIRHFGKLGWTVEILRNQAGIRLYFS